MGIFNKILNICILAFLLFLSFMGAFWIQGFYYLSFPISFISIILFAGKFTCLRIYNPRNELRRENERLKREISMLSFELSNIKALKNSLENDKEMKIEDFYSMDE